MLTQSLPISIGLFVVASIVGVACYYTIATIKDKNPFLIGFWIFMMVSATCLLFQSLTGLGILLLTLLIATVGAAADLRISEKPENFLFHLWRICLTIFFSLFIGSLLLLLGVVLSLDVYVAAWARNNSIWLFFYGLTTWPVVPPILLFLFRTSKLRPGIDRHLQEGESDPN